MRFIDDIITITSHNMYDNKQHTTCKQVKQGKTNGGTQGRQLNFFLKLNCPERDLNPPSPAYMAGALTTKPPRQLSRLGTNLGIYRHARQCNATKLDKQVNSNSVCMYVHHTW